MKKENDDKLLGYLLGHLTAITISASNVARLSDISIRQEDLSNTDVSRIKNYIYCQQSEIEALEKIIKKKGKHK